ncbi:MAG: 16S rRNA (guanine(966)-N(2))-methyltransferase RsmD [Oscillospiraceae bacterium]|jgi:16S rRNA (guanine(966)-N(2))-methyltransferase RsmD|nr:16S rRNA (guanine(966)-N(2))-methyltransferase RsmD [Oscillospiraceae bacterium]
MRIITGLAKGRKIESPEGENTRPTGGRVKEGLFSAIQFDIPAARILDLFAGSGQLGLEALSRGAKSCVFAENDRSCQEILRKNIKNTGFEEVSKLIPGDALRFLLSCREKFDIIFIDPPYKSGLYGDILDKIQDRLSDSGLAAFESGIKEDFPERAGRLFLSRSYRYGKTKITIYKKDGQKE